jgi:hypothetical protein
MRLKNFNIIGVWETPFVCLGFLGEITELNLLMKIKVS